MGVVQSVVIPKTIIIDGETGMGEYLVSVNGSIDDRDSIFVVPDESFVMSDSNISFRDAIVEQPLTQFTNGDGLKVGIDTIGKITIEDFKAGNWYGKFNFDIDFEFGE